MIFCCFLLLFLFRFFFLISETEILSTAIPQGEHFDPDPIPWPEPVIPPPPDPPNIAI